MSSVDTNWDMAYHFLMNFITINPGSRPIMAAKILYEYMKQIRSNILFFEIKRYGNHL